jgi:beta-lactamase superfamily II metal-dependent hydrolase
MADVFTLEALDAKYGDSLLLHYGDSHAPRLIVIDGGPATVYEDALKPRLAEIQNARGGGQLEIRMLMVSHIDLDHINGVLKLTAALRREQEAKRPLPYDILTLWHNSFDDLVGSASATALLDVGAAAASAAGLEDLGGIVAGVKEGRALRKDADALAINMNSGFDALIQFDKAAKPLKIGGKLFFTVVGPRKEQLDKLKEDWKKKIGPILAKEKAKQEEATIAAAKPDTSIPNLSSIVVLAAFGDPAQSRKTILLTGDAGGKYIVESLRDAGQLNASGTIKVDVLKLPHHGSARNCTKELFRAVHADHYVISANGQNDNPDLETFDNLFAVRPTGSYTIWMTNDVAGARKHAEAHKPESVTLEVNEKKNGSLKIEFGEKITW